MFSFKELIEEAKKSGCTCWTGYKRVPGTKPCSADSCIKESQRGLWDNIHAKQKRIKNGSGEKMRKPGSKGAPTADALKASQTNEAANMAQQAAIAIAMKKAGKKPKDIKEAKDNKEYGYEGDMALNQLKTLVRCAEMIEDLLKPDTDLPEWVQSKITLATDYIQTAADYLYSEMKEDVEGQFDLIEEIIMDLAKQNNIDPEIIWENFEEVSDEDLYEAAVDAKGHKSSTGGLTQKGRDAYNAKGAHLQAPVTTPPSKLKTGSKAANRRKSFCARMGGMEGSMKKPNGEPTRKALALRKWNC